MKNLACTFIWIVSHIFPNTRLNQILIKSHFNMLVKERKIENNDNDGRSLVSIILKCVNHPGSESNVWQISAHFLHSDSVIMNILFVKFLAQSAHPQPFCVFSLNFAKLSVSVLSNAELSVSICSAYDWELEAQSGSHRPWKMSQQQLLDFRGVCLLQLHV